MLPEHIKMHSIIHFGAECTSNEVHAVFPQSTGTQAAIACGGNQDTMNTIRRILPEHIICSKEGACIRQTYHKSRLIKSHMADDSSHKMAIIASKADHPSAIRHHTMPSKCGMHDSRLQHTSAPHAGVHRNNVTSAKAKVQHLKTDAIELLLCFLIAFAAKSC